MQPRQLLCAVSGAAPALLPGRPTKAHPRVHARALAVFWCGAGALENSTDACGMSGTVERPHRMGVEEAWRGHARDVLIGHEHAAALGKGGHHP